MAKSLTITVEYKIEQLDDYLAGLVKELIETRGDTMFSNNRGLFDLDPKETVTNVVIS